MRAAVEPANVVTAFPACQLIRHVEYGLTNRIAVHSSLPYMQVRYEGAIPHTEGFDGQPSTLDDGSYHVAFQHFYGGIRFKLLESRASP